MLTRFRIAGAALVALVVALTVAGSAMAAAPANDAFANATDLGNAATVTQTGQTNVESTGEAGDLYRGGWWLDQANPDGAYCYYPGTNPGCAHTVWYKWTAPTTGGVTVEDCDNRNFSSGVGVGVGATFDDLQEVGTDDGSCDDQHGGAVTFGADAGTVYWIEVAGVATGTSMTGNFDLHVYYGPQTSLGTSIHHSVNPDTTPVRFTLMSTMDPSTYECKLASEANYQSCTNPVTVDVSGLAEGDSDTLLARATGDGHTDPTPAAFTFTIDKTAPNTDAATPVNSFGDISVSVTSTDSSGRYECNLDDSAYSDCGPVHDGTGTTVFLPDICNGDHTLSVRAVDDAGNADATPKVIAITQNQGGSCSAPSFDANGFSETTGNTVAEVGAFIYSNGSGTKYYVEYGPTTAYGSKTPDAQMWGFDDAWVDIDGLAEGTTYHYRWAAINPTGTTYSADRTFTTKGTNTGGGGTGGDGGGGDGGGSGGGGGDGGGSNTGATTQTQTPTNTQTSNPTTNPASTDPLGGVAPGTVLIAKSQQTPDLSATETFAVGGAFVGGAADSQMLLNGTLGKSSAAKVTMIGRTVKKNLQAGFVTITIKLNKKAAKALKKKKTLKVTIKTTLTPLKGKAVTKTTKVTLKRGKARCAAVRAHSAC